MVVADQSLPQLQQVAVSYAGYLPLLGVSLEASSVTRGLFIFQSGWRLREAGDSGERE